MKFIIPDTIAIHYTATAIEDSLSAAALNQMHVDRGWLSMGYHWYITRDGRVWRGREQREGVVQQGAGVLGHNDHTLHICYEGGVSADDMDTGFDSRTPEQTDSMILLIRRMMKLYPSITKVVGHKDLANTQCPGFDVPAWWAEVEKGVVGSLIGRIIQWLLSILNRRA